MAITAANQPTDIRYADPKNQRPCHMVGADTTERHLVIDANREVTVHHSGFDTAGVAASDLVYITARRLTSKAIKGPNSSIPDLGMTEDGNPQKGVLEMRSGDTFTFGPEYNCLSFIADGDDVVLKVVVGPDVHGNF